MHLIMAPFFKGIAFIIEDTARKKWLHFKWPSA